MECFYQLMHSNDYREDIICIKADMFFFNDNHTAILLWSNDNNSNGQQVIMEGDYQIYQIVMHASNKGRQSDACATWHSDAESEGQIS